MYEYEYSIHRLVTKKWHDAVYLPVVAKLSVAVMKCRNTPNVLCGQFIASFTLLLTNVFGGNIFVMILLSYVKFFL